MLSGLQRHFSVVSLLLVAGAGLILLEGPVGSGWMTPASAEKEPPKAIDRPATPEKEKQIAKTINLDAPRTSWANKDVDVPLHPSVLGEIPLTEKPDFSPGAK